MIGETYCNYIMIMIKIRKLLFQPILIGGATIYSMVFLLSQLWQNDIFIV